MKPGVILSMLWLIWQHQIGKYYFLHMELEGYSLSRLAVLVYTVVANTPVGKIVHLGYFYISEVQREMGILQGFKESSGICIYRK